MKITLQIFSFRYAEQIMNSRLSTKQEIESALLDPRIELSKFVKGLLKMYQFRS